MTEELLVKVYSKSYFYFLRRKRSINYDMMNGMIASNCITTLFNDDSSFGDQFNVYQRKKED